MKSIILRSVIALVALLSVNVAGAQNAHFNRNDPPDVTDNGTVLCLSGTLHGLGNYAGQQIDARLVTEGTVFTECRNPAGNIAPGQQGETTISSPVRTFTVDQQGRLTISLCTTAPTVTSREAGCPNRQWTATVTDVQFTSATLIVGRQRIDVTQFIR